MVSLQCPSFVFRSLLLVCFGKFFEMNSVAKDNARKELRFD